ncbi:MAG: methionine adenosyltransferase domain-containing protein [Verrucomicrobiota bacterium]|nr:methionine adenosyltransferase domain-containing protein [Verrucomicrobiota bacterium]
MKMVRLFLLFSALPVMGQNTPVRLRSDPLVIQSSWDDLLEGVKTGEDWAKHRAVLKQRYLELIRDQHKPAKVPLDLKVHETVEIEGRYRRLYISYQVEADERTHAYMGIPLELKGKVPAVVALHGTTAEGTKQTAGISGNPDKAATRAPTICRSPIGLPERSAAACTSVSGPRPSWPRPILHDLLEHLEKSGIAEIHASFTGRHLHLNGAGDFCQGGPHGDNGLSGKKLVIDHYGPSVPIGGGALCGKDPHKVDRCGALRARQLAKSLVRQGASEAKVVLGWAPGEEAPAIREAETLCGKVRTLVPASELPQLSFCTSKSPAFLHFKITHPWGADFIAV